MKLIADSGSTKTDWAAVEGTSRPLLFKTQGYNPNYMTSDEIMDDLADCFPEEIDPMEVTEVYFYGAGINDVTRVMMIGVLHEAFPNAYRMIVESDLLGTARALLGHGKGFAAILGTGMNSCLYDGENITANIASLGFFLGDEGSAGYIGKTLLRDYLRGQVPEDLRKELSEILEGKTNSQIISELYSSSKPNTYCAEFCRFATDRKATDGYCHELIAGAFRTFFRNVVSLYPDYQDYSFNCIGSVACVCEDILAQVAGEFGMKMGTVAAAPMDGLIEYHRG